MTTYFSSDEHFGHQRIIEFSSRPFSSVEEMNEQLVENWNITVKPEDTAWILGDAVMGHIDKTLPLCARLNGTKYLLSGNHDRTWVGYGKHYRASAAQKKADWMKRYKEEGGFAEVYDGSHVLTFTFDADDIRAQMSHFPTEGDHTEDERYLDYRPEDDGGWLLHGHVHDEWQVRGRQINVGVDVWNYHPVSEHTLLQIILGHQVDSQ